MSRSKTGSRPHGTLLRTEVDPVEAMNEAATAAVEKALRRAERTLYVMFGITAEAYIGAETQANRHPRWRRVFIRANDDLPEFNFLESTSDRPSRFAIRADCPVCGGNVARAFEAIEQLAAIREAPVAECSWCEDTSLLTRVNVWTGEAA